MISLLVVILGIILSVAMYRFGYKMCEFKWTELQRENIESLIETRIDEIRQLYDEVFRNAYRELLNKLDEEKNKSNKN